MQTETAPRMYRIPVIPSVKYKMHAIDNFVLKPLGCRG
jgi:hypothetical protein